MSNFEYVYCNSIDTIYLYKSAKYKFTTNHEYHLIQKFQVSRDICRHVSETESNSRIITKKKDVRLLTWSSLAQYVVSYVTRSLSKY